MNVFKSPAALMLALCMAPTVVPAAAAKDDVQAPVVRLQSTVSGTQDQPRVMYIVPWQEPGAAEFDYALDNRLVQEVFAPIDRDEFVRELHYREKIEAVAKPAAAHGNTN